MELNISESMKLTQDELFEILDKKGKKQFDRSVAQQLYDRIDKDFSGKVTVKDFANVFLEAEDILRSKSDNTRK